MAECEASGLLGVQAEILDKMDPNINPGREQSRWQTFKSANNYTTDEDMARVLLDCYQKVVHLMSEGKTEATETVTESIQNGSSHIQKPPLLSNLPTYMLMMYVTIEQENVIRKAFQEHGWDFEGEGFISKNNLKSALPGKVEIDVFPFSSTPARSRKQRTRIGKSSVPYKSGPSSAVTGDNQLSAESTTYFEDDSNLGFSPDEGDEFDDMEEENETSTDLNFSSTLELDEPVGEATAQSSTKKRRSPRNKQGTVPKSKLRKKSGGGVQKAKSSQKSSTVSFSSMHQLAGSNIEDKDEGHTKVGVKLSEDQESMVIVKEEEHSGSEESGEDEGDNSQEEADILKAEASELADPDFDLGASTSGSGGKGKGPKLTFTIGKTEYGVFAVPSTSATTEESKRNLTTVVEENEAKTSSNKRRMYQCQSCFFVTKWKSNLNRHWRTNHDNTQEKESFVCQDCGKVFSCKASLRAHGAKHGFANYHCEICQKSFYSKSYFRGHLNSHSGLREVCDCGAKFVYPGDLTRHKKVCGKIQKEVIEKDFTCQECSAVFSDGQALNDHIKGRHEYAFTNSCICGRAFRWRSSLKYHKTQCQLVKAKAASIQAEATDG